MTHEYEHEHEQVIDLTWENVVRSVYALWLQGRLGYQLQQRTTMSNVGCYYAYIDHPDDCRRAIGAALPRLLAEAYYNTGLIDQLFDKLRLDHRVRVHMDYAERDILFRFQAAHDAAVTASCEVSEGMHDQVRIIYEFENWLYTAYHSLPQRFDYQVL